MRNTDQNTFSKRFFKVLPLLVIGLFAASGFLSVVSAAGISTDDVVSLANKSRAKDGLAALSENSLLDQAAKAKAKDMLKNDYFAHTSPSGVTPWHWIKQAGYDYKYAGENLAINYTNAKDQHNAWMKSPTHRENILNKNYRDIGVAVVEGKINGETSIITVELFGTPLHAIVSDKPAVTTPPAVKGIETVAAPAPEVPQLQAPAPKPVLIQEMNMVPLLYQPTLPVIQNIGMLDFAAMMMLFLVALSLLLPPLVFLSQVYLHFMVSVEEMGKKEGQEGVKKPAPAMDIIATPPRKAYKIV